MNISDSERVKTVIEGMGFIWTDNEEEASLLGIIACSVRQKSIDKVYARIRKWNKRKDRESIITFISGCVLPADKKKFLKSFDLIFPMNELLLFPKMIHEYGIVTPASVQKKKPEEEVEPANNESKFKLSSIIEKKAKLNSDDIHLAIDAKDVDINEFWDIAPDYNSDFEAFIPIQNGCDKFCTYCAVPYTRGREVSRPSTEIIAELKALVDKGYKSITLLGQNVNSYGLDKKGEEISFAQLLHEIGKYGDESGKDFWLYFTSPHPRDMGNDVIDAIASYKCIAKQIHLPLQSGDDEILEKMNRKHKLEDYRLIVNYIREKIPHASLFTDIIVGFTGETEEQFENSRKAIEEFKFNMAYVAIYSPRPGAVSAKWDDDIAMKVKKERLHKLGDELKIHSYKYNQQFKDKDVKVLITGVEKRSGYLSAYTETKIPVRVYSKDKSLIGKFARIKTTAVTDFSFAGEIIENE